LVKPSEFTKQQNKSRRQVLTIIKRILSDKKISITISYQIINDTIPDKHGKPQFFDTGERRMTLEWKEKIKK